MSWVAFRRGMRVCKRGTRLYGTVRGSAYDPDTHKYEREVLWDSIEDDEVQEPVLVEVHKLRPLSEDEYRLEALLSLKRVTRRTVLNAMWNPVDVRAPFKKAKIPSGPIAVKGRAGPNETLEEYARRVYDSNGQPF
jgi:hypothetical protein